MENGEVLVYYVLMTDRGAQEGNLFLSAPLNNRVFDTCTII